MIYKTEEKGICYYQVLSPDQEITVPDTSGEGMEVLSGSNAITLTGLTEEAWNVVIVVKDYSGNISEPLVVEIPEDEKERTAKSCSWF